jgi:hypothetical protein
LPQFLALEVLLLEVFPIRLDVSILVELVLALLEAVLDFFALFIIVFTSLVFKAVALHYYFEPKPINNTKCNILYLVNYSINF